MKKLLLSFGLFGALLAGHANAADFIVAEPVPVAPEAPPADDWTGFYLGGHLGWAWDDAEWTFTNDSFWGDDGSGRSLDLDGFIGGGQAGYWHQFQNDFVLGADISASYTDLDGSFADDTVFRGTATFTAEVDWLLLAQARIGYTHDRLLIFVQGGYAGADGTASANYTDFASDQTFSDSNWHNGWTIGGGFSYKATETLSFGAEYNYVDLNSDSYSFDSPLGAGPAGTADVDHQMHVAKFTINYHFGGN